MLQEIIASLSRIMLILCLLIYIGKEVFTIRIYKCKEYLKRVATYRNIATIISIILITYNGLPKLKEPEDDDKIFFQRWQYHVASFTCLLVWVEMASFFSKIPLFGKYCHMFK